MNGSPNRRRYLKAIGAGAVATAVPLAGCSGGDGGDGDGGSDATPTPTEGGGDLTPNHDVPHPDDGSLPEAEASGTALSGGTREPGSQSEKDNPSVGFQHVPNGGQNCGTCSLYVPDQDGDGYGVCTAVAGKISPCDWCLLYTEYTGEDGVPCEQS